MLNLVLRECSLRPAIVDKLRRKFKTVVSYKLAEDLNEVLVCGGEKVDFGDVKKRFGESSSDINAFFKRNQLGSDGNVHVEEFLNNLNIL
mgnify:CR=1 FL=1